ncbi:hypothetical protein CR513_21418, partial [Mucuna pruriens]
FKENALLSDHLNEFQGIIDQMSRMGIKFEDEILGLLLLNSLPESWETFKVFITNSSPNGVISLQMVKDSVLNEEMRRKAQGSSSQSELLVTKNRGRSKKKEREKSKSKSKSRYKNVECHYCHKQDIYKSIVSCRKKENKDKKRQQGIRHEKTPKTPQLNGLAERMNKTLIERAFVHVLKDERSKLDMKTRQCIFIGYGHDEYGYKMYDPVEKKLVRSRDAQFMEDETIEDIDKNGEQHNYVGNQQLGDDFDVPPDDDVEKEQEMSQDENLGDAPEPPPIQLKKSNRQRQSYTRYTSNEYMTLTDGEEPKYYQESMESEERKKAWQSKLQKCVALSTTKAELGFVQDEHWLFYDS